MFHYSVFFSRLSIIVICTLILSACNPSSIDPGGNNIPSAKQSPGPLPSKLYEVRQAEKMPAFSSSKDVRTFVSWASQAPVSRRSEIRIRLSEEAANNNIAEALIEDFKSSELKDHSRALVILSLLGELKNEEAIKFLTSYVWEPLPEKGIPMEESGIVIERYNKEILQSKAVVGLAYSRDQTINQRVLEVISKHPSNVVRAEAIAAYLWNNKISEDVKNTLRQSVRRGDEIFVDRPIRTSSMSATEFNEELAAYLNKYPELTPPTPQKREQSKEEHDHGKHPPRF